ncbi:MAG: glycosyltransferase family 2 protein [Alistipes sp.]|nr:glycosyltransferase family 2 protein [Alistipes sp.]MBR2072282.1 glycosyltransferase family 2 protein [Alistipes sp.]MBR3886871.1 glycosyltransferase family 2 protein [Alistipes sp.]
MVRLSIVIATYNRSAMLMQTLQSVIEQTLPREEWECVVVNNNSTDSTAADFDAFAARYPDYNLRMVLETNQGLSYARNRGIRESEGEYIAIVDDDERIAPEFVASYVALFDDVPDAVAAGGPIVAEYPTGRPRWMSAFTERPIANTMYFGEEVREFPRGRVPGGGNMALRRSAVRRYGVFDTSLGYVGESLVGGEESDLFERLQIAEAKYYYVPKAVMYHIIPKEKLTVEYLRRLSYNVGVSQLRRARYYHRKGRVRLNECGKWLATLVLAAWYGITLQWRKAKYLIIMRYNITRGLWSE